MTFPVSARAAAVAGVFLPIWCLGFSPRAAAQAGGSTQGGASTVEVRRQAMERLAYMVGDWQGDGWIQRGARRVTFQGGERVQSKLGGLALLVEGSFTSILPGSDAPVPVHTTLGVITYDPESNSHRFRTWLGSGSSGERPIEVLEDGWRWEMQVDAGTIRYTTRFTQAGEWIETGEFSPDGESWREFFGMTLRKQDEA